MIFSWFLMAEWPPFGRGLLIRFTVGTLCFLTYCNFSYFPFWFEGGTLVLIASVPVHCLSFTVHFINYVLRN